MTTLPLLPLHLQPTKPSPTTPSSQASKTNPFARPKATHQSSSFTRSVLLPTSNSLPNGLITPREKTTTPGVGSQGKGRNGFRLLWRGGFEIGDQGYRLDGITFFANLSFPQTPSVQISNPFDDLPATSASPFTNTTTDLCLSLESMRGRKYLQVRGVVELGAEEVLEGQGDDGGVQMSVAPEAVLLAGYLTGLLCRNADLSPSGRTLTALSIGLGDEVIDSTQNSTILIYGQLQPAGSDNSSSGSKVLRLCVGRRKPKPPIETEKKVRPGDPLPRAPLFLPIKQTIDGITHQPPLTKRTLLQTKSRTFTRAPSTSSSIYHPPPNPVAPAPAPIAAAPISGRTPGRRGEKRKRMENRDEDRMRRAGRVVPSDKGRTEVNEGEGTGSKTVKTEIPDEEDGDDDVFGRMKVKREDGENALRNKTQISRMMVLQEGGEGSGAGSGTDSAAAGGSGTKIKRIKVPQQILDNKATVRKQTLLILEERGYPRTHEVFKDVFAMTTKGVYFALRDKLEYGPIMKKDIHVLIHGHLDMYLPERQGNLKPFATGGEGLGKVEDEDVSKEYVKGVEAGVGTDVSIKYESSEGLESLKEEDEEDELIKLEDEKGFG